MDEKLLIEARRKAEQVVSEMVDPQLRVKAFEIILQKLLTPESNIGPNPKTRKTTRRRTHAIESERNGSESESKGGRICQIRDAGFFKEPRSISEVRDELRNRGWIYELTSLSGPLQKLVQRGGLRRALAKDGNKKVYKYVNP